MAFSSSHSELIELLADEFAKRQRQGERPTIEEYAACHPEIADEIREVFPALVMMEQVIPVSDDLREADTVVQERTPLRQLGEYRILRELGLGGMGVVYEAEQESLQRRVALKVLTRELSTSKNALERFQREARAAARMHHTNIVPVFEVGQEGDTVFYTMQLIHGQGLNTVVADLRQLREHSSENNGTSASNDDDAPRSIAASLVRDDFQTVDLAEHGETSAMGTGQSRMEPQADGPETETAESRLGSSVSLLADSELSAAESDHRRFHRSVGRIGIQIAEALSYAHARGIIHRDIKPSNLIVDAAGVVWVTDFGLAKLDDDGMTHTGDILGTLRYMSPERFSGRCDVRADIYSLGLTLYELVVLRPAFDSPDRLKLIELVRQSDPPKPRTVDARIPRDLETIILKAIDKEPKRRYQSADEFADDLQRFVKDEPIRARRVSSVERFARWARRNKAIATSLVTIAFLLTAITIGASLAAVHFRETQQLADERADRANRLAEGLTEILELTQPSAELGSNFTVREFLDMSVPTINALFASDIELRSRVLLSIGNAYQSLQQNPEAQQCFQDCLQLRRTMNVENDVVLIRCLSRIADSPELSKEAYFLAKQMPGEHELLAEACLAIARVSPPSQKLQFEKEGLTSIQKLPAHLSKKVYFTLHWECARTLGGLDREAEGLALLETVISEMESTNADARLGKSFAFSKGHIYREAARIHMMMNQLDKAEKYIKMALRLKEPYGLDEYWTRKILVLTMIRQGRFPELERLLRDYIANHDNKWWHWQLAELYRMHETPDAAEPHYRIFRARDRTIEKGFAGVALLELAGFHNAMEPDWNTLKAMLNKTPVPTNVAFNTIQIRPVPRAAWVDFHTMRARALCQSPDTSQELLRELEGQLRHALVEYADVRYDAINMLRTMLCLCVSRLGRVDDAVEMLIDGECLSPYHHPLDLPNYYRDAEASVVALLQERNDAQKLAELLEAVLMKRLSSLPIGHPHIAFNQLDLAHALIDLRRYDDASSLAEEAFQSLVANQLVPERRTREAAETLVTIHELTGAAETARSWKEKLRRLSPSSSN